MLGQKISYLEETVKWMNLKQAALCMCCATDVHSNMLGHQVDAALSGHWTWRGERY